MALGLQNGSVRIYLVDQLCDGKDFLYDQFHKHKTTVQALTFVHSPEGYQLACLDKGGFVSLYSLVDR